MNLTSSSPPFDLSKNHGPAVSVVSWILIIISTLSIMTRFASKYGFSTGLQLDDFFALSAWLFHVGETAAVSVQATSGLGQDSSLLTEQELRIFAKTQYAALFLYVATTAAAKLSIVVLLGQLSPARKHLHLNYFLGAFISVWAFASILATSFQCNFPKVWNSIDGICFDRSAFWRSFGVLNIITDGALVVFPTFMMWGLHMKLKKRLIVLSCFAARGLDIAVAAVQLAYTEDFNDTNTTAKILSWTIACQFSICVTVVTSCVPYLRPFLEAIPSGAYRSDEMRRRAENEPYDYTDNSNVTYRNRQSEALVSITSAVRAASVNETASKNSDTYGDALWDLRSQNSRTVIVSHNS